MTPHIVLVLGGARSGKSAWAEQAAAAHGGRVLFLATATASDPEMAARIAAHQTARPKGWHTIEEPLALAGAIRRHARPGDVVLVDCLTVWLGNLMVDRCPDPGAGDADWAAAEADALAEVAAALAAAESAAASLLLVSNEVGLGLVPPTPLGRAYRDALGRLNGRLAAAALWSAR